MPVVSVVNKVLLSKRMKLDLSLHVDYHDTVYLSVFRVLSTQELIWTTKMFRYLEIFNIDRFVNKSTEYFVIRGSTV
jgi:hypothetical protein